MPNSIPVKHEFYSPTYGEHDQGPWEVSADGRLIVSDDFTHDVSLTVNGDFYDNAQRKCYTDNLAAKLNRAAKPKELALAASMLRVHADSLSNAGCNDWSFPADWTTEDRVSFVREFHAWNGDPENFNENHLALDDHAVAAFLAHKLTRSLGE